MIHLFCCKCTRRHPEASRGTRRHPWGDLGCFQVPLGSSGHLRVLRCFLHSFVVVSMAQKKNRGSVLSLYLRVEPVACRLTPLPIVRRPPTDSQVHTGESGAHPRIPKYIRKSQAPTHGFPRTYRRVGRPPTDSPVHTGQSSALNMIYS